MGLVGIIRCRVSPLQTRSFCFGKRTQNHFRPCAALWVPPPPPHPKAGRQSKKQNQFFKLRIGKPIPSKNSILILCVILVFAFHCVGRGWSTTPNRLFGEHCLSGEVALDLGTSCAAIMIRGGGPGTRRNAHGQKWFWALLPKQKCLVARGQNPALKFLIQTTIHNTPNSPRRSQAKKIWIPD